MVGAMLSRRSLLAALTALALAACGTPPKPAAPAKPATPTPTPGRPAPALLQVENAPDSRPHSGLQGADMVFEYLTEGGITRFTVVYLKPSGSTRVGPDRSARLVALRLVHAYGGVLFYSGASDHVLGMIWDQHIPNFDDRSDGGKYFARDSSRQAPHNLYTTGDQMAAAVDKSGTKVTYQLPQRGEPAAQPDAQVAHLSFQQTYAHSVSDTYDPASKTYQYRNETGVETDAAAGNQPLKITNVVLLRVPHHGAGYTEDVNGQEGIDFDLQGQGQADVYTRGGHFPATWSLPDPNQPLELLGADGKPFTLPEGLTWFYLVDPGMPVATS